MTNSLHDFNSNPEWSRLVPLASCRVGEGIFVEYKGLELGVFVLGPDEVHIIDNACPHSGGNLSAGLVRCGIVTCPLHEWEFRLNTGQCVDSPAAKVTRYSGRIRDGWVEIKLEA